MMIISDTKTKFIIPTKLIASFVWACLNNEIDLYETAIGRF